MWYLKFQNGDKKQYLLAGKAYTIGRKGTDITITDDSSVSRRHATIEITLEDESNPRAITMTDSSKFGTFFARNSGSKPNFIKVNGSVQLKMGDLIRIGMQHTFCKLINEPLTVVVSMMNQSNLSRLQSVVAKLGGNIANTWQPCATHLAINQVILNVKVTQALANAVPIVEDDFFVKMQEAIEMGLTELPNAKDFIPPISENGLDNDKTLLVPTVTRKSLFKDRVFVFLSTKQLKRLGQTCAAAGGKPMLKSDISTKEQNKLLDSSSTAILIPPNLPETPLVISETEFNALQESLSSKGRRFLQEHEIGLALLYDSADVYTNPEFELTDDITFTQPTIPGGSMSQMRDSAPKMESQVHETLFISRVPETVQCDTDIPSTSRECSKKRPHAATLSASDSSPVQAPAKSQKIDEQYIANDIFNDFETRKRGLHPKPAPKRKPPPSKSPRESKVTKMAPVKQEKVESQHGDLNALTSQNKEFDVLHDSCIADDSLWSCKADSQEISKNTERDMFKNFKPAMDRENDNEISQSAASAEPVRATGCEKVVHKKAFTPATVPDDEDLNDLSKFDPDLPCIISNVLTISLVKKKTPTIQEEMQSQSRKNSKNFKKFVKVHPAYKNAGSQTNFYAVGVPRIIGGRDLIRHSNQIERVNSHAIEMLDGWSPGNGLTAHLGAPNSQDINPFA